MTSEEIGRIQDVYTAKPGNLQIAAILATLEVALQLARLNEGLASLTVPGGPAINVKESA